MAQLVYNSDFGNSNFCNFVYCLFYIADENQKTYANFKEYTTIQCKNNSEIFKTLKNCIRSCGKDILSLTIAIDFL